MTVLVGRRETFNAAHQLYDPGLSDEQNRRVFGKCANLHGHNYVLEVVVAGEIDPNTGYVVDLKHLSDLVCRLIVQEVDHRNLNTDVGWLDGVIPTAENLALAFWARLRAELVCRLEPELYARLATAERIHPGVIAWLPDGLGRIVEVAAGTGRLTLELVHRAREVIAIEPAAPLRAVLSRKVAVAGHAHRV